MGHEGPTPTHSVRQQLDGILASIQTIERQVASGRVPVSLLEDFKMAVDEVRLRLWALMASASSGDPAAVQRFRLLRTADCCRITTRALASGDIDDRIAEVQEAVRSAEALAAGPWRRPPSA